MAGKFVSFEGVDSSGKSTLIEAVGNEVSAATVSGFSDSAIGDGVQELRNNEWMMRMEPVGANAYSELYMFLSEDIYQFENRIRPRLESGQSILNERQIASKLAYQMHFINREFGDDGRDILDSILETNYITRILPDHIIFLHTPMDTLIPRIERIDSRTVTDEEYEVLASVQENYRTVKQYFESDPRIDSTTHWFNTDEETADNVVNTVVDSITG